MKEETKSKKVWYQKWWIWVIAVVIILFAWMQISRAVEKKRLDSVNLVPNIMGINYADAQKLLEAEEFEVSTVEADAGSVLGSDIYNRSVNKGEVFKVNDETDPNYTDSKYSPMAEDEKVIIYYAKEDYVYVKPTTEPVKDEEKEQSDISDAEPVNEAAVEVIGNTPAAVEKTEKLNDNSKYLIDGNIKIKLDGSIPQTICEYSDIDGSLRRSHDITKVYAKGNGIYVDGTKKSDKSGNEFGCKIMWRLYNESGAVVGSDWTLSPAIGIGENYVGVNIHFKLNSLEPGNYTLQFCDVE